MICRGCGRSIHVPLDELGTMIECSKCGSLFQATTAGQTHVPEQAPADSLDSMELLGLVPDTGLDRAKRTPTADGANETTAQGSGSGDIDEFAQLIVHDGKSQRQIKHSGLGMASFIIAMLVGGMELILGLLAVAGVANSGPSKEEIVGSAVAGSMAMLCLTFLCLPLSLVGGGLGVVALVAHKQRNHLFTWIGVIGNGIIVLIVLGVIFISMMPARRVLRRTDEGSAGGGRWGNH